MAIFDTLRRCVIQTFLPVPNFGDTALVLDWDRLSKQRDETLLIMRALLVPGAPWSEHPVVKMWGGHEACLLRYQEVLCRAVIEIHNQPDEYLERTHTIFDMYQPPWGTTDDVPRWFGDVEFHIAHQSNLVRKNREYYKPIFPDVPEDLEYVYPVY